MELLPAALEKRLVSYILHERVLEGVDGIGRCTATEDELSGNELVQRTVQLLLRKRCHGGKQFVAELAANARCNLRDLLDDGQAIKACHEGVVKRRRDCERRQWSVKYPSVAGVPK